MPLVESFSLYQQSTINNQLLQFPFSAFPAPCSPEAYYYISVVFPRRDDALRRTIYCAVFALLVSSGAVFAQTRVVALRSVARPRSRVIFVHRFPRCLPLFIPYTIAAPLPNPVSYPVTYPVWDFNALAANYVFVGSASPSHPQLVFKDGTTYSVTDYWRVGDQLHFITVEEGGTKFVPHSVPFEDLDVQRTTDRDAAQGFQFVIRDEPIEQWLEHRAHASVSQPTRRLP